MIRKNRVNISMLAKLVVVGNKDKVSYQVRLKGFNPAVQILDHGKILKYFHSSFSPVYVCSPDSLKLGFRCTRRLELRILWPILDW